MFIGGGFMRNGQVPIPFYPVFTLTLSGRQKKRKIVRIGTILRITLEQLLKVLLSQSDN
jgi:hypothetical protein